MQSTPEAEIRDKYIPIWRELFQAWQQSGKSQYQEIDEIEISSGFKFKEGLFVEKAGSIFVGVEFKVDQETVRQGCRFGKGRPSIHNDVWYAEPHTESRGTNLNISGPAYLHGHGSVLHSMFYNPPIIDIVAEALQSSVVHSVTAFNSKTQEHYLQKGFLPNKQGSSAFIKLVKPSTRIQAEESYYEKTDYVDLWESLLAKTLADQQSHSIELPKTFLTPTEYIQETLFADLKGWMAYIGTRITRDSDTVIYGYQYVTQNRRNPLPINNRKDKIKEENYASTDFGVYELELMQRYDPLLFQVISEAVGKPVVHIKECSFSQKNPIDAHLHENGYYRLEGSLNLQKVYDFS